MAILIRQGDFGGYRAGADARRHLPAELMRWIEPGRNAVTTHQSDDNTSHQTGAVIVDGLA